MPILNSVRLKTGAAAVPNRVFWESQYFMLRWPAVMFLSLISAAGQSNGLDHFSWAPLPTTLQAGQPAAVSIQARDLGNNVVSGFSGQASLSGLIAQQNPTVLITEVETISTRRVELSNGSTNL